MNKEKLIGNLAKLAVCIAIVSFLGIFLNIRFNEYRERVHEKKYTEYITSFINKNNTYLKGIAARIKSLSVDPDLLSTLESEYAIENQKAGQLKRFIWMSDSNDTFIFGVPSSDFKILNNLFDKYQDTTNVNLYFADRNDFLNRLIDKKQAYRYDRLIFRKQLDGSVTSEVGTPIQMPPPLAELYKIGTAQGEWTGLGSQLTSHSMSTSYSTSIYDDNGKVIGGLFMKVDDSGNADKYVFEGFMVISVICSIFLALSCLLLWYLLPTWVYMDAKERGVNKPGTWAFLTLISLIFGLIIYLLIRPANYKSNKCPKCEVELNGTRAYCPYCGHDLSNLFCQQCQYPIRSEWHFCPNCKAETNAKEAPTQNSDPVNPDY